ncbi:MAG: pyridoxal phosphate-dependent aminotransferase [Alphaproteobacteria bacterium]|nr:pyridoxal phosphate-dependent aminotransferase [Alphaproteobacteria bacterium]
MRFSPLVDRVSARGAGAWRIQMEAGRRRDAGEEVIFLTVGDPDQAPPEPVIDATIDALRRHRTGYSATVGFSRVRQAIAARFQRRTGQPCGAENVVVTTGAQGGLFCALQCLAGPGDEVIVPEPIYATYAGVTGASGAHLTTVPLRGDRGFHPDIEAISRAVTPRTRVIWINSPHNPTGAVFTAEEITRIAELCRSHDLWLLSDEVYEDLAFARPHVSPWSLPGMAERTVVVSSLSKSHAIPGFRFGWIIGPATLSTHLFDLLLCMTYGSPAFVQDGVLPALEGDLPEVDALREAYRRRAKMLSRILRGAPHCCLAAPEGGMFVLLDIRGTGLGSEDFARRLLEREKVAVLPCDSFGPSAVGHLRIALTVPDRRLAEAGRRIVRFARELTAASSGAFRSAR